MTAILSENTYFCVFLTLAAFEAGKAVQKRWKSPLLNSILLASIAVVVVLLITGISVDDYQKGCAALQYLLTPATICFAISLYEQLNALKKHIVPIILGVLAGSVASLLCIRFMAGMFALDEVLTVSLMPKSITTAIGMVLSEEAGGIVALTSTAIAATGILGNIFGETLCRLFAIRHPIAQGVAFGTASHAVGTSRAHEISHLVGAVSSLSLTIAGLITVVLFSFLIP